MLQEYQSKVELAQKVMRCEETEYIPFFPNILTWGIGYAGGSSEECLDHPLKEFGYYQKALRDFHLDGVPVAGVNNPQHISRALGYTKVAFPDGITLTIRDESIIEDEDLKGLADNFMKHLTEVCLPRRYPILKTGGSELNEALKDLCHKFLMVGVRGAALPQLFKLTGTPYLCSSFLGLPIDNLMPMRGFKNLMVDFRRHPSEIKAILEQMYLMGKPTGELKPYPFTISPMTTATYLNAKNFEEFFIPTSGQLIKDSIAAGSTNVLCTEGKWGSHLEWFRDLPSGKAALLLDEDAPADARKMVGDDKAIWIGFDPIVLSKGAPHDVCEKAKELIDSVGNKGVAMTTGRALLSPSDAPPENLHALADFCHGYRF